MFDFPSISAQIQNLWFNSSIENLAPFFTFPTITSHSLLVTFCSLYIISLFSFIRHYHLYLFNSINRSCKVLFTCSISLNEGKKWNLCVLCNQCGSSVKASFIFNLSVSILPEVDLWPLYFQTKKQKTVKPECINYVYSIIQLSCSVVMVPSSFGIFVLE